MKKAFVLGILFGSLAGAITATPKGPNQINLTWAAIPNPRYGYLVEIQSPTDSRYTSWTEWKPIPAASGYSCDPSVTINGATCSISDPTGIHVYKPPTNGIPWWVTEPNYKDPQDGTPAQFIAHGLMPNTAYSFRVRTYTGNKSPVYGSYSNVAVATTSAYDLRYVSMTGVDTNDGTASDDAHAWRSVSKSSSLTCGQALIVLAGTYDRLHLSQVCTPAQKVVVMADPGATVTLQGGGIGGHSIVLDGLTVRAAAAGGDYILVVGGTQVALLGMDTAPAKIPQSDYNGIQLVNNAGTLIYGSYIHDFGSPDATQNPGGNGGFPLAIANSSGNVIWSNHLTRGGHDTSLCKGGCTASRWLNNIMDGGWGMGWEAIEGSTGNLVEGNIVFDPGQLISAYKPALETSSAGNTIRRNLILNAKAGAVEVSALEGMDTVIGTHVYNNTFYRPGSCFYESSNGGEAKYAGLLIANNLCYKTVQSESAFGIMYSRNPASQISYNSIEYIDANDVLQPDVKMIRYYGGGEYPTTLALAEANPTYNPPFSNNLAVSALRPMFVNEAEGDFHLIASSPLRGKGMSVIDSLWGNVGTQDIGIGSPTLALPVLLSINAGAAGDIGFKGGAAWAPDLTLVPEFAQIPPPYFNMRYSSQPFSYQLVTSGSAVKLQFIEPRKGQLPGVRMFDVLINGVVVIPALDLAAVAGSLVPQDFTFPVPVGLLTIRLNPIKGKGNAILSGIQILGDPNCK